MTNNDLSIIVVTLGICLPDHTWKEEKVEFECDPDWEDKSALDLNEEAFGWWCANQVPKGTRRGYDRAMASSKIKSTVTGSFIIHWEWKD